MNIVLLSGGSGKRLWPLSNDVRVRGYKVKKTRAKAKNVYASSESSQQISLKSVNNGENRNTQYLRKLMEKFNAIDWKNLK